MLYTSGFCHSHPLTHTSIQRMYVQSISYQTSFIPILIGRVCFITSGARNRTHKLLIERQLALPLLYCCPCCLLFRTVSNTMCWGIIRRLEIQLLDENGTTVISMSRCKHSYMQFSEKKNILHISIL